MDQDLHATYTRDSVAFVPKFVHRIIPKSLVQVLEEEQAFQDDSQAKKAFVANFSDPHSLEGMLWSRRDTENTHSLPGSVRYHSFTPEEAQQCLASKRVLFVGDSHMRNTWRGTNDLVAGVDCNNYYRWDGHRSLPKHLELPLRIPDEYNPEYFPAP